MLFNFVQKNMLYEGICLLQEWILLYLVIVHVCIAKLRYLVNILHNIYLILKSVEHLHN